MPVPVWAALLAVAVAKKVVVFTAAKVCIQSSLCTTEVLRLPLHVPVLSWCRYMAFLVYIESSSSWLGGLYETRQP